MLLEALDYQFMRHALVAGLLASLLCGVLGTFVVVRRLVFISGGVSHAAFGGVGLALWLGVDARIGAALVAVAAALLLRGQGEGRGRSHDAKIGVLWAVGMAVGMVCLARRPDYAPDLVGYLFGDILAIGRADLVWLSLLTVAALAFFGWFYRDLVAATFDPSYAQVQGASVARLHLALLVLVALSVVGLIQVVGIILVIALLTLPPLIALRLAHGFLAVVLLSTGLGLLMTAVGLAFSYRWNLPSGPVIVLCGAVGLGMVELWSRWENRSART